MLKELTDISWTPIHNEALLDRELKDSSFRVYCFLRHCMGNTPVERKGEKVQHYAVPFSRIERELGYSSSTVNRALKELEARGYIEIDRGYKTTKNGNECKVSSDIYMHRAFQQDNLDEDTPAPKKTTRSKKVSREELEAEEEQQIAEAVDAELEAREKVERHKRLFRKVFAEREEQTGALARREAQKELDRRVSKRQSSQNEWNGTIDWSAGIIGD